MKNIKVEMTIDELLLVSTLISDQLFRKEFIDPKMPGYKRDPAELAMGKDLALRLKAIVRQATESAAGSATGSATGPATGPATRRAPSHLTRNPNGIPNAV
jgi:hypothetical protein